MEIIDGPKKIKLINIMVIKKVLIQLLNYPIIFFIILILKYISAFALSKNNLNRSKNLINY